MYWHQYWLTIITDCIIWMRDVNRGNSCSMGRSKKGGVIWQISHCQWLGMDLISCYLPEKKKCLFNIQSCLDSGLFPMPFLHLVFFNLVKYVGWPRFPLTVLMILSPLFCLLPLLAVRGLWWERSVMEPEVRTCKERVSSPSQLPFFLLPIFKLTLFGTIYSSAQHKDKSGNHGNKALI